MMPLFASGRDCFNPLALFVRLLLFAGGSYNKIPLIDDYYMNEYIKCMKIENVAAVSARRVNICRDKFIINWNNSKDY